jgi:IS605 OrfB family transposase
LTGGFETVVIENLDVAGMVRRKKKNIAKSLRRSIHDAGWGELRRQLTYRAEDRGHRLVVVDRFYPLRSCVLTVARRKPSSPSVIASSRAISAESVSIGT